MFFDFKYFEDYVLAQFKDKTRHAVSVRQAAESGKKLASDDITQGYLDQKRYDQTVAELDARRIKAKQEWKPALDAFNEKAKAFGNSQLKPDMNACAAIAPVLELMGSNDADYMEMARQYNNYGQLRIIASAANKNGATRFGGQLEAALDAVRKSVDDVFGGGMGASAERGVLGQIEGWEIALDGKLDRVKRAVRDVDVVIGAAEAPKSAFAAALENAAMVYNK